MYRPRKQHGVSALAKQKQATEDQSHHLFLFLLSHVPVGSATSERPKRHQNHHRADHDPAGFVALGVNLRTGERPHNFTNVFESTTNSSYGLVMALLNITWSYIGYSNVNYGFSETKRPVRKFKTAAALALTSAVIRKRPQPPGRK
ncbi:hypothetical protein S40288_09110 [Stachybotrys chartarum IBT 40288]|nr:hypothetical protein S40288_09110 [Stachybotrys chartarum IBT 40288]